MSSLSSLLSTKASEPNEDIQHYEAESEIQPNHDDEDRERAVSETNLHEIPYTELESNNEDNEVENAASEADFHEQQTPRRS